MRRIAEALALLALLGVAIASTGAYSQDLDKPVFVVATEAMDGDRTYRRTVILALPVGQHHMGVILNRPTSHKMIDVFPEHQPSAQVMDPVHFGGPYEHQSLFAMVKANHSPGPQSIELMPGVWLVVRSDVIDRIIETKPNEARYYAGMVVWQPGELEREVKDRMMVVRPADRSKLYLPDTSKLYEDVAPKRGRFGI